MKKKPVIALMLLFLVSCSPNTNDIKLLGTPTEIGADETPIDVMRRIYVEFVALRKPLLKKTRIHKQRSRTMFIDFSFTKETLPSYYEYVLTDEAYDFISKHSYAEITASLLPILLHPEHGGEAAVLIVGMMTSFRYATHEYGRHVSHLSHDTSHFLFSTKYRSPMERGQWNCDRAIAFNYCDKKNSMRRFAGAYKHLCFTGSSADFSAGIFEYKEDTLHFQLSRLQHDNFYYENGLVPKYSLSAASSFAEWLEINPPPPMPEPAEHTRILIEHGVEFVTLGLFPAEMKPGLVVHALGLQKYWPVAFGYGPSGLKRLEEYDKWEKFCKDYKKEIIERRFDLAMSIYDMSIYEEQ